MYDDYKRFCVVEAADTILDFVRDHGEDCGLEVGDRTDLWYFLRSIQNHIKSSMADV